MHAHAYTHTLTLIHTHTHTHTRAHTHTCTHTRTHTHTHTHAKTTQSPIFNNGADGCTHLGLLLAKSSSPPNEPQEQECAHPLCERGGSVRVVKFKTATAAPLQHLRAHALSTSPRTHYSVRADMETEGLARPVDTHTHVDTHDTGADKVQLATATVTLDLAATESGLEQGDTDTAKADSAVVEHTHKAAERERAAHTHAGAHDADDARDQRQQAVAAHDAAHDAALNAAHNAQQHAAAPSSSPLCKLLQDIVVPEALGGGKGRGLCSVNLWMCGESEGTERLTSTLHYDGHNNLLVCVSGAKTLMLFPPDHRECLAALHPVFAASSNHCRLLDQVRVCVCICVCA